jgi:hypothetical protein
MMKATTNTTDLATSTREARYQLFQIDSKEADTLRLELFVIDDQDGPLPVEFLERFNKAIA